MLQDRTHVGLTIVNRAQRKVLGIIFDRVAEPGDRPEAAFLHDEVRRWPAGMLEALVAARLVRENTPADMITCGGCEERCLRPVVVIEAIDDRPKSLHSTCDLFEDKGPFDVTADRQRQWSSRRQLIATFLERGLDLKIKNYDDMWRRIRFETLRFGDQARLIELELSGAASIHVGASCLPLLDVIDLGSDGLVLDRDALAMWFAQSEDMQSGSKRRRPSTTVREDNKILTSIRTKRAQFNLTRVASANPTWNKNRVAKDLVKHGRNEGFELGRLLRVTVMPERKK